MKKLKLILIAMIAMILAGAAIGATLAYFTAQKTSQNVFTAGAVTIQFTELDAAGNTVDVTDTTPTINYGLIYPGRVVQKNSTIKVLEGSMPAYLAAKIVISDGSYDINSILGRPGLSDGKTKLDAFLQGGPWDNTSLVQSGTDQHLWENANYIVYYEETETNDTPDGFVIYVLVKAAKAANDSVTFLSSLNFPATWTNAEFVACTNLSLHISVFAVQSEGLGSCKEAMLSSFKEQFKVFESTTGTNP